MNKKIAWTGHTISIAVTAVFAFSAVVKLFPRYFYPQMPEQMVAIGLPLSILHLIAALEILCVVTYLIPQTAVLGAVLFTGYLGGAILTHIRVGQPVYTHIVLGGLIWLGIYLREPRLHKLLPFRRKG